MGCYGSTALSSLQRNVFHCNGTKDRRAVIPKALHCTDHETYAATEISLTNDIAATLRHASAPTNPRSANSHGSRSQTRSQVRRGGRSSPCALRTVSLHSLNSQVDCSMLVVFSLALEQGLPGFSSVNLFFGPLGASTLPKYYMVWRSFLFTNFAEDVVIDPRLS
ncbi:uncharacterized protein [Dermacentor albipictus]|uniref:uncharacterized protein isoform X1 n=1 Tax=Dermacentor albipictus TaxID=60249 RepID=UPI0038FBF8B3